MLTIAARFILIIANLRKAVAAFAGRSTFVPSVFIGDRLYVPIRQPDTRPPLPPETWNLLLARLSRAAARFQALFDRWRSNTLPRPCKPRATPLPSRVGQAAAPRLPSAHVWVVAHVGWQAAGYASQIGYLLDDAEMPEFLTAAPQAGRILRPLCHMLGIQQPNWLKLPARARRPRTLAPLPASSLANLREALLAQRCRGTARPSPPTLCQSRRPRLETKKPLTATPAGACPICSDIKTKPPPSQPRPPG